MSEETIGELVERRRAAVGYDPEFEARLARIWRCPHCRHETTILGVLMPPKPGGELVCPKCKREGIQVIFAAEPELHLVDGGKRG